MTAELSSGMSSGESEATSDSRTRYALVNEFFAGNAWGEFQFVFWKIARSIPVIFWNILRVFPVFFQLENRRP